MGWSETQFGGTGLLLDIRPVDATSQEADVLRDENQLRLAYQGQCNL